MLTGCECSWAALDTAQTIEDMQVPGFRLHSLKGKNQGPLVNLGEWEIGG